MEYFINVLPEPLKTQALIKYLLHKKQMRVINIALFIILTKEYFFDIAIFFNMGTLFAKNLVIGLHVLLIILLVQSFTYQCLRLKIKENAH